MENEIAIQISYKIGGGQLSKEYFDSLKEDYIIISKPDNRPQSGGLYDALIHIIANTTLSEFLFSAVTGGFVWDLVKIGSRKFFLKPFLKIIEKIEAENEGFDYGVLSMEFEDATIHFHGIQRGFISSVGFVLNELHRNYSTFFGNKEQLITQINVPVVNYEGQGEYLRGDILYECDIDDYKGFWGITRNYYETDVWDVKKKSFISKPWHINSPSWGKPTNEPG